MTAIPPGAGPEDHADDPGVVMFGEAHDSGTFIQIGSQTNYNIQRQPRGVTGKPVRLLPRPPVLAGREDLLAKLDAQLTSGEGTGPRLVALWGLPGAGKTSVAVEYAHRRVAEVGVAWQLPAENAASLAAGFTELAAQLGELKRRDVRDPVESVHAVLARYPVGWLLVFDNASGPAAVREFVPPAGDGQVLITSRNALWPPAQAVEVPVLDLKVAAEFLVERTGDPDRQAAAGLSEAVGGLPLALEQAAAHMQATGDSLAAYLTGFQRRRADFLARGEPTGYPGTVATTWALAFGELEESAPGAAGLLRLLAFCAPEAVPLGLLLRPRRGLGKELRWRVAKALKPLVRDGLTAGATFAALRQCRTVAKVLTPLLEDGPAEGDAVAALRRFSLARPAGDGAVSVHRLVQAVTADRMPAGLAVAWRQAAAALIEAALPEDPRQPDTWPVFAALLPHAQATLAPDSPGMMQVASYLGYSGNFVAARELMRGMLGESVQNLGPEHPSTMLAHGHLSVWTGRAGDAAAARDQSAALLAMEERLRGAQHPETLTTRANLANWTGTAGDAAGARDQYAALLPIRERVSGPEDPATLAVRGNLARWTGEAGDAAGARDQYAALLPISERVLGPEHPDTLMSRGNLAYNVGASGDAAGARDQYAALLPIRERVSGPEDPETLIVRSNLALWTGRAGDAAGARDQYAALLPISEQVLGPEHPNTLNTRGGLASMTGRAGDKAGARDQFAALLSISEQVLGPEHPDTLNIRGSLASWTGLAGDMAGSRAQLAALLAICERVLGPQHPSTLTARAELANCTGAAGDAAGARDQLAALLPISERVLGPEHPDTLMSRGNLAYWTGEAERGGN
jgi:Tetratricopeptide repeat